jgi:predicted  nucleic acid-binding Zn-ribbon protein
VVSPEVAAAVLERARRRAEEERKLDEMVKEWARGALGIDLDALERLVAHLERRFRELEGRRRELEALAGAPLFGGEDLGAEIARVSELAERYWASWRSLAVAVGELKRLARAEARA